jgi:hypothetical protein
MEDKAKTFLHKYWLYFVNKRTGNIDGPALARFAFWFLEGPFDNDIQPPTPKCYYQWIVGVQKEMKL